MNRARTSVRGESTVSIKWKISVSRFHNKGVYVKVGLQKMSHTRNLHKEIKLQVDQHEVELPSIEGLIFINIPR